ncbi:MAG: DUF4382 domain-containing protein [Deltaproteobacteria bacterium]|nr:DUF4382 domain-containing protein [Deltaproteobacteria bacterium]
MKLVQRVPTFAFPATFLLGLGACGGDASMELQLMDAPPEGVTAVEIYVASMQLHVVDKDDSASTSDPNDSSIDDDNRWESLSVNKSIDLVAHQGEAAAEVLGQLDLPEGKITQIRLQLDTSQPNTATKDGTKCDLLTSKVAKKGIKINHPFKAFEVQRNHKHVTIVDFELDKSLKPSGDCFELEPKIKLHKFKLDGIDVP